ncbi:MAG TPA: hypothetical protein VHG71_12805 [Verrucomicrobiae bacterium]|nr:hypothetical protein [Verrucomicrobiae bacterium]
MMTENSPQFSTAGQNENRQSPEGAAEIGNSFSRPFRTRWIWFVFQPLKWRAIFISSLRDTKKAWFATFNKI